MQYEEIAASAAPYKSRIAWRRNEGSEPFMKAQRMGILSEVTVHMQKSTSNGSHKKTYEWTVEELMTSASKYSTRAEWKRFEGSAQYNYAYRMGFLEQVTAHMTKRETKTWTEEKVIAEAIKYDTRKEFREGSLNAYQAAIRMGIEW